MKITELLRSAGRQMIRAANAVVDLCVLTVFVVLIIYVGYTVWDSARIYQAADAWQYESYKPTADNTLGFAELRQINPEVCSWLTIYGTAIDYPVAQGNNNSKYINVNAKGEFSLSGSLFIDSRNAGDFSDPVTIIYGHHMENSLMFGDLEQYRDVGYCRDRRYGSLYSGGRDYGLEVLAYFETDAYDTVVYGIGSVSESYTEKLLTHIRELEAYELRSYSAEDRLVLLSTCGSGTNERYLLVCRLTDQTYSDPYKVEEKSVIRSLFGKAQEMPWLYGVFIGAAILLITLIVVLLVLLVLRKTRKKRR